MKILLTTFTCAGHVPCKSALGALVAQVEPIRATCAVIPLHTAIQSTLPAQVNVVKESAWAITKIKKNKEKICSLAKREYICIRFERISQSDTARCGSSVWLECRPVTPEVEGSSPFRTAKPLLECSRRGFRFEIGTTLVLHFVNLNPLLWPFPRQMV